MEKAEAKILAMEGLFQMCKAIHEGELSTLDLKDAVEFSVADGHDMALIELGMVQQAIKIARRGPLITPP